MNRLGLLCILFALFSVQPVLVPAQNHAIRTVKGEGAMQWHLYLPRDPEAIESSPDGQVLAVALRASLYLIDFATGAMQQRIVLEYGTVFDLAFTHDGSKIAVTGVEGIDVYDIASRKKLYGGLGHPSFKDPDRRRAHAIAFTNDDSELLSIYEQDKYLRVWSAENGTPLDAIDLQIGMPTQLALSPDGGHLAVIDRSGKMVMLEMSTRQALWRAEHFGVGAPPAFSADGTRLAVGALPISIHSVQDGSPLMTIEAPPEVSIRDITGLRFIGGDTRLVTCSAQSAALVVWQLDAAPPASQVIGTTASGREIRNAVVIGAEGSLVALAGNNKDVYIYRIPR